MKYLLPLIIFVVTAILIVAGTIGPTRLGATTGITSGSALPGLSSAAKTPEQAVDKLLNEFRDETGESRTLNWLTPAMLTKRSSPVT